MTVHADFEQKFQEYLVNKDPGPHLSAPAAGTSLDNLTRQGFSKDDASDNPWHQKSDLSRRETAASKLDSRHGHNWTGLGAATPVTPQGLEGSTPWRTCYKGARSKQGITASSSLTCSNTAIAELSKGSNTPPTNSTNLWLTMQHKSGTA